MKQAGWRLRVKQAVDRGAAALGLIATAPVMAATAVAVRRSMGAPVLFRQVRPGLRGEPFELLKFRTMRDATDAAGRPLPDDQRMTVVGQLLRRTSLDELPQLVNVLRGELSLVGPRPLLVHYLERYSPEQARRHDVLPGITGWSQTHGRNASSWPTKLTQDVWYVDHWSLLLDLKILLLTVTSVLRREGISHEGHVTTPEFLGERE
ncbi:MAG: sugar transferase [Deltaproteobacteria bacterium]|nr:sugar transferase [Deltaproteobacteria bacterium]